LRIDATRTRPVFGPRRSLISHANPTFCTCLAGTGKMLG
jgi:hypothetical protein